MRSSNKIIGAAIFLPALLLFAGCIIPNQELLQLKSDVALLKEETAGSNRIDARLSAIEKGLGNLKGDLGKEIESVKTGVKRTGADSSAEADSLRADYHRLSGSFEEIRHLVNRNAQQNSAFIETAGAQTTALEQRVAAMEKQLTDISNKLAAMEKRASKPDEADASKRPANEIYREGLDAIKAKKPQEARQHFRSYLKNYPEGPLANNAQFWIGESYYDEGEYERAIVEFDEVIRRYPGGIKVPASLLKQAMSFEKLKDKKTAGALFNKLIKEHPDTEEAKTAGKMVKKK